MGGGGKVLSDRVAGSINIGAGVFRGLTDVNAGKIDEISSSSKFSLE